MGQIPTSGFVRMSFWLCKCMALRQFLPLFPLPCLLQKKRVEQFRAAGCSYTSFGSPGWARWQRTWVLLFLVMEQPLATAHSIMVKPLGWA